MRFSDNNRLLAEPNGRDRAGRFITGNRGGHGNPYMKRVHRLRSALMKTVTPDDIAEVIQMLIHKAKSGDLVAAKELLDRTIGKANQTLTVANSEQENSDPIEFTLVIGSKNLDPAARDVECKVLE